MWLSCSPCPLPTLTLFCCILPPPTASQALLPFVPSAWRFILKRVNIFRHREFILLGSARMAVDLKFWCCLREAQGRFPKPGLVSVPGCDAAVIGCHGGTQELSNPATSCSLGSAEEAGPGQLQGARGLCPASTSHHIDFNQVRMSKTHDSFVTWPSQIRSMASQPGSCRQA